MAAARRPWLSYNFSCSFSLFTQQLLLTRVPYHNITNSFSIKPITMISSTGPAMTESHLPILPMLDLSPRSASERDTVTSGEGRKPRIRLKPQVSMRKGHKQEVEVDSSPTGPEANDDAQLDESPIFHSIDQSFCTPKASHFIRPANPCDVPPPPLFPSLVIPSRDEKQNNDRVRPYMTLKPRARYPARQARSRLSSRVVEIETASESMVEVP